MDQTNLREFQRQLQELQQQQQQQQQRREGDAVQRLLSSQRHSWTGTGLTTADALQLGAPYGLLGNATLGNATLGNTTLGNTTLGNTTLGNTTLGNATFGNTTIGQNTSLGNITSLGALSDTAAFQNSSLRGQTTNSGLPSGLGSLRNHLGQHVLGTNSLLRSASLGPMLSNASESSSHHSSRSVPQRQISPNLSQQSTESFLGGWQSNARDMEDRRHMIHCILRIIRGLRPDTSRLAKKLSEMAKGLEEHLYKTAKTKQEYMDQDTLRSRLFTIAQGMEERTNAAKKSTRQQQEQETTNDKSSSKPSPTPQQNKVILQQQQRLLLLRHASKCKDGASCTTQFCGQITALWKHLRSCRNKDCDTPHCKTSRCVLNHYRACKTNKTFATCPVCGPFTKKIKQMDRAATSEAPNIATTSTDTKPSANPPSSVVPSSSKVPTLKGYLQHLQLLKRELARLVEQERQLNTITLDQDITALQEQLQVRQQRIQEQQLEVQHRVEEFLNEKSDAASPPVTTQSAQRRESGKGKRINKLLVARPSKKRKSSKPNPSVSVLSCMTVAEITKHLESLNKRIELSARTVTYKCRPLVQALMEDPNGWVFRDAVDPVALGVLDYFEVIKKPMHLTLAEKKLENAMYPDMESFANDVRLIFDNAILYNGESSRVGELAQDMLDGFNQSFAAVVRDIESSHNNLESKGEVCSLCGLQNRRFEPSVLYCQGACGLERIKRNAKYYTDRTKQNHWCDACYDRMKPDDPVILDDGTKIRRSELQDYKNDALAEEKWVSCDECKSWVHQVCALFNDRMNRSDARYRCPNCELRKKATDPVLPKRPDSLKSASELPGCKMTDAIEAGLEQALKQAYQSRAASLGVSVEAVEKVQGVLSVRVLSDVERKHVVGEKMYERYKDKGCASEFPVRTKCIGLFQKIDGVDVLLFAMYVYEYGDLCPAPNKRRVYISYLDSVQYFEPKCYRTNVYHTIMVEYLRYVKRRGFHTAHIWSCPPTPGDDYIFYSHPKHQLVPREDMLRAWYHRMLDQAKSQGVVLRTTTLFDEYFGDDSVDMVPPQRKYPYCLPYFEGDYIPGELENIIRRFGHRSSGEATTYDSIMSRIGGNLAKMKDNFIVAHLRNRRFAAAVERGEDVSNWREDSEDEMVRSKRAKISGKAGGNPSLNEEDRTFSTDGSLSPRADSVASLGGSSDFEPLSLDAPIGESADRAIRAIGSFDFTPAKTDLLLSDNVNLEIRPSIGNSLSEDQGDSKKRSLDEMGSVISNYRKDLYQLPKVVPDTTDEDSPFESELFESRQQFLNYCQTTHSQFDELRRAKHTSLMVLFLLHNPSAPKFVQQCGACYNDITHGLRYHCRNCSNFDLCESCYDPVTSGQWAKRDPRFAHPNDHCFIKIDMEADAEETKTAAESMKKIKNFVELLEHASFCRGAPECSLQNCARLKTKFIKHVSGCDIKRKRDCRICKKILGFCTIHARLCTFRGSCPVPFCDKIRESNNRLKRQQQLMDDRRRNAQNELYHASGDT